MRSEHVRLFQTMPHTCGYYADRVAQNLVIDPAAPHLDKLYPQALAHGFRRAGGHLYHPRCASCRACTPCRIPVARFMPDRSQRRCMAHNADMEASVAEPGFSEERHDLYRRYLAARHPDGGMDTGDAEDFTHFLVAAWSTTRFLELRLENRLVGVAVTDVCADSLSAVYTFYEPALSKRGLGTLAILAQIDWARRAGLPHLYLGYWIAGHPKMDYKRRFQPLEIHGEQGWQRLEQGP